MINIAVVEDDNAAANLLLSYIKSYQETNSEVFSVKRFNDAVSFMSEYKNAAYDIIFMDIEMPGLNGMEAATKLRKFDRQAILIFVTNMAQYAVKGYEVDALHFILKPVSFQDFNLKLKKAVQIVKLDSEAEIVIPQTTGFVRIPAKEVIYVEVMGHKLNYHTGTNIIVGSGSLTDTENKLKSFNFMRCSNCFLVNPKYIMSVQGMNVIMRNGETLLISHPKKKKFMTELADWLGQGNSNAGD